MRPEPRIAFGDSTAAWAGYSAFLRQLIHQHQAHAVCELGGGANPALSLEEVVAGELDYTLVDICSGELAKAPDGYHKVIADLCDPRMPVAGHYDFIFSRMLLEHLRDAQQFHRNVWRMLRPGGVAFHFFPTLYSPVFLANRLLHPAWTRRLLAHVAPRDPLREAKFPAYYRWCRGPSAAQIRRFESLGYSVLLYRGFFGHNYYARIPAVRRAHRWITRLLVGRPLAGLTSYAYLLLGKPSEVQSSAYALPAADPAVLQRKDAAA